MKLCRNLCSQRISQILLIVVGCCLPVSDLFGQAVPDPCRIRVVDADNGWPVPLVELTTNHHVRFVSDNAGVIAFDLPELMGETSWFTVRGHGYEVPADGFGFHGVRLTPTPGGELTVKVERKFPAKRLGRITGSGLFGESERFAGEPDWKDQGILGCDSVQLAVYGGRLHWLWGDTTLARYPLGLFHMLGATTEVRPLTSFEPPVRLRYDYVTGEDGRPRVVAPMPGDGPTWVNGFTAVADRSGQEQLVGVYTKIEPPLTPYEVGLCVWNDDQNVFETHRVVWNRSSGQKLPPLPDGHPVKYTDQEGTQWLLFGDPLPHLRCEATFEAWEDPTRWESLTPQRSIPAAEGPAEITPHRGSIAWSDYLQQWIAVLTQMHGESSEFGEIWLAVAPEPTGPWRSAVQVVSHDNYTFYNPRLHPEWTIGASPILLFEGTYTHTFADRPVPTPRYDYNQILYRVDLDDDIFADAFNKR